MSMPDNDTASSANEALAGALEYIEAGYRVGPVTITLNADGKKDVQFHTNWVQDPAGITGDIEQATAWSRQYPGCSWHAPCGPNGMVVAEGDVKGDESGVWNWRKAGGPASPMKVTTRSGGEHWYFRAPEEPIRNSAGRVPGVAAVDVRGDGGTVFIAGSVVHGGGGHYWAARVVPRDQLPELSESWARRLRDAGRTTRTVEASYEGPQTHEVSWLARKAEQWFDDIASGEESGFRERLFAAAFFGFHAVDAGLLERDEVIARCREAIRITWGHEPDDDDREWLNDAWRKAAANPWTLVEDGELPVPDDVGNQSEPVAAEPPLTSDGTTGTSSGNQSEPVEERSTWWPKDIGPYLGEESEIEEEPGPVGLTRDDGQALIYAGKVNGLIGESESGKSWVALHAAAQALGADDDVLYVDFEDSARGVVSRLRALGASSQQMANHLQYVGPQESLASVLARTDFAEVRTARDWSLIVVDGFNVAMTLLGLDLNSNDDATKFYTRLLRPLAATGAAVLYVDHVPKNADNRGKGGIGAQQKRALTDGAALRVEINEPFGRGQTGRLRITVDKDRPGHVRGAAMEANWVGTAVLSSDVDTGDVHAAIEAPKVADGDGRREPTTVMVKISEFLMTGRKQAWSTNAVVEAVGGRRAVALDALAALARRGYITQTEGTRKSVTNQFVKRFTTLEPSDPAYFLGAEDEENGTGSH